MGRGAGGAVPGHAPLLHPQQALHLCKLSIALLEDRRPAHEDIEPEVVADCHLIGEPAQIPMKLGDLLGKRIATTAQLRSGVGDRRGRRWRLERPAGRWRRLRYGPVDVLTHDPHRYPVDTTSGSALDFSS